MSKPKLHIELPVWVTARFLYALGFIAVLCACAPAVKFFTPLAILAGVALGVATLADALRGPRAADVKIRRIPRDRFTLAAMTWLEYAVENRSSHTIRAGVVDTPVRTLRFDADEVVALVEAHATATIDRRITPIARGADRLGTLYVWYENELGLLRRRLRVDAPEEIRVYPDLAAVERFGALHVRNRTIEAGLRKMRLRGRGTEFESVREWSPGDDFHAIEWKATARRGKIMVVQHEVERSQNVILLLDCGRLMTPRTEGLRKLDYAVTAALSLAAIAGLANDRVGFIAFAHDIIAARAPRSTRSSMAGLADLLYDLEPRFEEADYARAFAYLRGHLKKRSLIVFLTDVVDPLGQVALLAELGALARHHLVLYVFMNDAAVDAALATVPATVDEASRASVALDLAKERRTAKAMLERTGALVIDVPAKRLSTALIDEYLRIKQRGLL